MPRELSFEELEQVTRKLTRDSDEFHQLAQVKAVLRLLRDDEFIDKDLLKYADQALSLKLNRILKSAVPQVQPLTGKTVGEMLSITDDEILSAMRKAPYSARTSLHR